MGHRIVREDGTEVMEPGEVGELHVRSPWIMLGYSTRGTRRGPSLAAGSGPVT